MQPTLKLLRPTQLDALIAANQPVYVLNTSSMPSGDKGMIVVNFYNGNRRDFFKMPPTFIPMAISDAIPPNLLKDSRDFRQILLKGMLTLVEPESAEAFLSSKNAQGEYEALVLSEHSMKAQNIDVESQVARRATVAHSSYQGNGPVQDISDGDSVSNKVRGVMESLVSGTLTTKEALQQLRRHQSAFNEIDFSYIMGNSRDTETQQWARECLAELTGSTVVPKASPVAALQKTAAKKPVEKVVEKAVAKSKSTKKESSAFDFGGKDDDMTPEDQRADAEARARAMESQALDGRSKASEEISKILSGG